jgi:D-alanyl-D-alanine carboxypeptidase
VVAERGAAPQSDGENAGTDAAWTAKTKNAAEKPQRRTPSIQIVKTRAVPTPSRAVRPEVSKDAIAQVLAKSAGAPATAAPAQEPQTVATAAPRLDLKGLREAMAGPTPDEGDTDTEDAPALPVSAAGPQDIAGLIKSSIVEGAPRPAVDRAESDPAVATAGATTGAPTARGPSTLDSQAMALANADASPGGAGAAPPRRTDTLQSEIAPPSHLREPTPPPQFAPSPVGKGFEIQIGAYNTADEAQSKIELVRGRAVGLLEGHTGVALPVQKADRQMFRARFVGFGEDAASSACLELRRLAIDCFVMKAE